MRLLDELAANATAASIVQVVDGWLLRAAPELPFRRSNSAIPFAGDFPPDLDRKVVIVEDFYARHGRRARVQVSDNAPAGLDEQLATRHYDVEAPVDVLVADVATVAGRTRAQHDVRVVVTETFDDRWIEACGDRVAAYQHILRTIGPVAFAVQASLDGAPSGVACAVVERGWVGVYGMHTVSAARRRGVAGAVLRALTEHAGTIGAARVYLQVEVSNEGAQRLYDRAGFTRSYGYHYRRQPTPA